MVARRKNPRLLASLIQFDLPYRERYGIIAGVDEVGRGPLAGPVVAGAVILPAACRLPGLNDSKLLSSSQRERLFTLIQRSALALGIGIVDSDTIDRLNIRQASFLAMRRALDALWMRPHHVLVDGFRIPNGPPSQTGIVRGDAQSQHIAAAAIIAKVTRDAMMEQWDRRFPGYGFGQHKGYGTERHLNSLKALGPTAIHRRSFAPVRDLLLTS